VGSSFASAADGVPEVFKKGSHSFSMMALRLKNVPSDATLRQSLWVHPGDTHTRTHVRGLKSTSWAPLHRPILRLKNIPSDATLRQSLWVHPGDTQHWTNVRGLEGTGLTCIGPYSGWPPVIQY